MKTIAIVAALAVALLLVAAGKPGFGNLYYDGGIVRTLVPPAAMPHEGVDDLYVITGGVPGQLGVAAVAPGAPGYHGGKWAFHRVSWKTTPYLLKSSTEVLKAFAKDEVTIVRVSENDFKCPIQP